MDVFEAHGKVVKEGHVVSVASVDALADILWQNGVDVEHLWEDAEDKLQTIVNQISRGKCELHQMDTGLCLVTERLRFQLRDGPEESAMVLLNTHKRAAFGSASCEPGGLPTFNKSSKQEIPEAVSAWVSDVLGVSGVVATIVTSIVWTRKVRNLSIRPSDTYPCLFESAKTTDVEVALTADAWKNVPGLRRGRPLVGHHPEDVPSSSSLWCWFSPCLCDMARDGSARAERTVPSEEPFDDLLSLVAESLVGEAGGRSDDPLPVPSGDEAPCLRARADGGAAAFAASAELGFTIAGARDAGGSATLAMVVTLPRQGSYDEEAVLVWVERQVTDKEQLAVQERVLERLYAACPSQVARQVGSPFFDNVLRSAVWRFALDGACWYAPELSAASRRGRLVALFDEVLRCFCGHDSNKKPPPPQNAMIQQSSRRKFSSRTNITDSEDGGLHKVPAPSGPASDLASDVPRSLSHLAGSGGALGIAMLSAHGTRLERSLFEHYAPAMIAMQHIGGSSGVPPADGILGDMSTLLRQFSGEKEDDETVQPRIPGVSLRAAKIALRGLQESADVVLRNKNIQPTHWRPLSCPAHGALAPDHLVADAYGSLWICSASISGGTHPCFMDIASLALQLLLETLRPPITYDSLCAVAVIPTVTAADFAYWLRLRVPVAAAVLHAARKGNLEQHLGLARLLMELRHAAIAADQDHAPETCREIEAHIVTLQSTVDLADNEAALFAKEWVEQLDSLNPLDKGPPDGLSPEAQRAWRLQEVLLKGAAASYTQALNEAAKKAKFIPSQVDRNPLLLELAMLHHVSELLKGSKASPWQKMWLVGLFTRLAERLRGDLLVLNAAGSAPVSPNEKNVGGAPAAPKAAASPGQAVEAVPKVPAQPRVPLPRFAAGHRMLLWRTSDGGEEQPGSDSGEEGGPTGDGGRCRGRCLPPGARGSLHGITLSGGKGDLNGKEGRDGLPLPSWPCPLQGIGWKMMWHLQRELGVVDVGVEDTEAKRFLDNVRAVARVEAWRRYEGIARCLYEVMELAPADPGDRLAPAVEDAGPGMLLQDGLDLQMLHVRGLPIGFAAIGAQRVRPCLATSAAGVGSPRSSEAKAEGDHHSGVQLVELAKAYSRFPCSVCQKILDFAEEVANGREGAHCAECREAGQRFDLCGTCASDRTPVCANDEHQMVSVDESPYDAMPVCCQCSSEIPQVHWAEAPEPEGDFPSRHPVELQRPEDMPYMFHCYVCDDEHGERADLCRACWSIPCAQGHGMVCVDVCPESLFQGDFALENRCEDCGHADETVYLWQCLQCYSGPLHVSYPNADAALADIKFNAIRPSGRSPRGGGKQTMVAGPGDFAGMTGAIVVSFVVPGGLADCAGVRSHHTITAVNGTKVSVTNPRIFNDIDGPVQVDFQREQFEVVYSNGLAIQQDLVFRKVGHKFVLKNHKAGGLAMRAGVGRGFRLLAVNEVEAEALSWDGMAMISDVMEAPCYTFRFGSRGPEAARHISCGVRCPRGHTMEPRLTGAINCGRGHLMRRALLADFCHPGGVDARCIDCFRPASLQASADGGQAWCLNCPDCSVMTEFFEKVPGGDSARSPSQSKSSPPSSPSPSPSPGRRQRSSASKMSPARRRTHAKSKTGFLKCWKCASDAALVRRSMTLYTQQGLVECADCSMRWLPGQSLPTESDASEAPTLLDSAKFFHCQQCFAVDDRYDLCPRCARHHLRCDAGGHSMKVPAECPYAKEEVVCAWCEEKLSSDGSAFHCADCWLRDGARRDRCQRCANQDVVLYTIDEEARFQVLANDGTGGEGAFRWPTPVAPEAPVQVGHINLVVRLRLQSFAYPESARVRLLVNRDGRPLKPLEATIRGLHKDGLYEAVLDGTGGKDIVEFDPVVGNHMPAGVWRYSSGQELTVFVGAHGWLDVRVFGRGAGDAGCRHLVQPVDMAPKTDSAKVETAKGAGNFQVDVNTWNHAVLRLPAAAFLAEQRSWDMRIASGRSSFDVLTCRRVDVLQHAWALQARSPEPESGTEGEDLFAWLLRFAESSTQRHLGHHEAYGAWIEGEPLSGKTTLLNRIAAECVRAHGGEMVPLFVDVEALAAAWRESEGQPETDCDILEPYLRAVYTDGSRTYLFLKQALQARRMVLLVDDVHLSPAAQWSLPALARCLEVLVAIGHRVVATCASQHLCGNGGRAAGDVSDARSPRASATSAAAAVDSDAELWAAVAATRLRRLRLSPPCAKQRLWRIAQRLDKAAVAITTDQLERFAGPALSTAPLLELIVRFAEVTLEPQPEQPVQTVGFARQISKGANPAFRTQAKRRRSSGGGQSAAFTRMITGGSDKRSSFQKQTSAPAPTLSSVPQEMPDFVEVHEDMSFDDDDGAGSLGGSSAAGGSALPAEFGEYLDAAIRVCCRHAGAVLRARPLVEPSPDEAEEDAEEERRCQDIVYDLVRMAALVACKKGSGTLSKRDMSQACDANGMMLEAWSLLQPLIHAGRFFILGHARVINSHGQLVTVYRFPHPALYWRLVVLEVHRSWGTLECPVKKAEDLILDGAWHEIAPLFAERLKAHVTLHFQKLSDSQVSALSRFLEAASVPLSTLDLRGVGLGQQVNALRRFAQALELGAPLQNLDLGSNGLGSAGAALICQAVAWNRTLTTLVLEDNHIGHVGARHVEQMLRINRHLTSLNMAANSIGDEGMHSLLPALSMNPVLRSLDLRGNNITIELRDAIRAVVSEAQFARVLHTAGNRRGLPDRFSSVQAQEAETPYEYDGYRAHGPTLPATGGYSGWSSARSPAGPGAAAVAAKRSGHHASDGAFSAR